jgi:hypothetical protein
MSSKQIKKSKSTKTASKKTTASKSTAKATRAAAKKQEVTKNRAPASGGPGQAAGGAAVTSLDPRMPAAGTVIQKKDRYGIVRCECTVEDGGIRYAATVYRSLSAAAMAAAKDLGLTNKTQNGWTFWGLTKPPRPSNDPVETLERGWARYQGGLAALKDGVTDENRATLRTALRTFSGALGLIHRAALW